MNEQELQRMIANLRVGIAKVESGGESNPYAAQPDWKKDKNGKIIEPRKRISTASGKYQFLASWLNNTPNGVMGIKSFAEKSGAFNFDGTMEDFRNQPNLQEAYFSYYAENVLIPEAQKIAAKNPLNLSLDSIAAGVHFEGYSNAKDHIQSGKLSSKTDDNVSGYRYLDIYNSALKQYGLKPITSTEIIKSKEADALALGTTAILTPEEKTIKKNKEQSKEQFKKRNDAISNLKVEQGTKEAMRRDLYKEYVGGGNIDVINDHITEQNTFNQNEYSKYRNLENLLSEATLEKGVTKDGKPTFKRIQFSEKGDGEQALKDFPELLNGASMLPNDKGEKQLFLSGRGSTFPRQMAQLIKDDKINMHLWANHSNQVYNFVSSAIPDILKSGAMAETKTGFYINKYNKPEPPVAQDLVKESDFPQQSLEDKYEIPEEEAAKTEEVKKKEEEKSTSEASPVTNAAEEFLNNQLSLDSLSSQEFNYEPGKKELPIDAVMGMAMGLIGNNQAKNAKIPLRTEDVSNAIKSYTAQLMAKSKEGIPVEIEAAMKNQIADIYQGGLAQIVNASAGNRATVLGNLGSLEQAKTKGLIGVQIADYEAKDRAFAQYGQAIQYIDQVDINRDIANHGIKYTEAKTKQLEGKQLATAGFAKLMEALKTQRETGPGSPSDMARSLFMQKIFGFDPAMKDDGKGKAGTKSAYDRDKAQTKVQEGLTVSALEKLNALSPSQKQAMDKFARNNTDVNAMNKAMDHMIANPNLDLSTMNLENAPEAFKKDDMSLLFPSKYKDTFKQDPIEQNQLLPDTPTTVPNVVAPEESITTPSDPSNIFEKFRPNTGKTNMLPSLQQYGPTVPGSGQTPQQWFDSLPKGVDIDPKFLLPKGPNIDPGFLIDPTDPNSPFYQKAISR